MPHLLALIRPDRLNVFTLHAEIEGMRFRPLFVAFLTALRSQGIEVVSLTQAARACLACRDELPICSLDLAPFDGRSGRLAVQGRPP